MATVNGTAGNDFIHRAGDGQVPPVGYTEITGVTTGNDTINGLAGDDIIFGDSGNDFLNGGLGADQLDGGAGFDYADYIDAASGVTANLANPASNTGEAAGDTYISIGGLRGSNFDDTLIGNSDINVLLGGPGADVLNGGGGVEDFADYLGSAVGLTVSLANPAVNTGEAAGDTYISINGLIGSNFDDTLIGDGNGNFLRGKLGADVLNGGGGSDYADYLTALSGVTASLANPAINTDEAAGDTYISIENLRGSNFDDTLIGNAGNNFLRGGLGADSLDGGAGNDWADYAGAASGVVASLANPASNTGEAAGDTYSSIERLRGSAFNDTLIGDNNDNFLRGGAGADSLDGGGGRDYADYIDSPIGLVVNLANPASNTGIATGDTYTSIERIRGSDFNDTLTGDASNNTLRGGLGADVLNGGAGFDYASYADATVGLLASLANPALNTGEAAGDTYTSIEALRGSDFNDTLIGNASTNHLQGGLGADSLDGGGGFDYAEYDNATAAVTASLANPASNTGEAAGDTYSSIEGLIGSDFNDTLIGDDNNNFLNGGLGADSLDGGNGSDFADYINATAGVVANLADPTGNTGEAAGDIYSSIENLRGSNFNDTLTGDGNNNFLRGGLGADSLDGGAGSDWADYRGAATGVVASLADPTGNTGEAAGDTYGSIENLRGSDFADTLIGDDNINVLRGDLGADVLNGNGGFDYASYSNAAAAVTASLANPASNTGEAAGDTYTSIEGLIGSAFNDTLIGDGGDNFLRGGLGADSLDGGAGDDYADYINATAGLVVSLADPTSNTGEAAGDTYNSIERVRGSDFNDTLIGDANNNTLRGGLGADVLNGGAGSDFASYSGSTAGLIASLANPASNTGEAAGDTYISIENLRGSDFNDTLIGDDNNNFLNGGLGADSLDGGNGSDFADYINATAGVVANLADPTGNTGEAAGDIYSSIENLRGSNFNDTLTGDGNNNFLRGGLGADSLDGGAGSDWADYRGAATGVVASLADPTGNTGEAAGDTYGSIENLRGSDFADTLIGDAGDNRLRGLGGADSLNGGGGFDVADYGNAATGVVASLANPAGNTGDAAGDAYAAIEGLVGSDFADTLIGDAGNNSLSGGAGGDILNGGLGDDTLTGGTGGDTFVFAPGYAADTITDFTPAEGDRIDLSGFTTITAFSQVQAVATQVGANTVLAFGNGDTLTLNNVTASGLTAGNFVLAPPAAISFGPLQLAVGSFGGNPAAGGWASQNLYPRAVADINGDGRGDVVGFGEAGAYTALGQSDGSFALPVLAATIFGASTAAGGWTTQDQYPRLLGDVNGDGLADIVGFGYAGAFTALGQTNGTFGSLIAATANFGFGPAAGGWTTQDQYPRLLGDVNGDGRDDIVGFGYNGAFTALGQTDGTFAAPIVASTNFGLGPLAGGWASQDQYPRLLGDVNGDGRDDIVGFGYGGAFAALGQADGTFGSLIAATTNFGSGPAAGGWTSQDLYPRALADANGDGQADIIGFGATGTYAAPGLGDGTFASLALASTNFGSDGAAGGWTTNTLYPRLASDVNGDARADIVGFGSSGVYVALSQAPVITVI